MPARVDGHPCAGSAYARPAHGMFGATVFSGVLRVPGEPTPCPSESSGSAHGASPVSQGLHEPPAVSSPPSWSPSDWKEWGQRLDDQSGTLRRSLRYNVFGGGSPGARTSNLRIIRTPPASPCPIFWLSRHKSPGINVGRDLLIRLKAHMSQGF